MSVLITALVSIFSGPLVKAVVDIFNKSKEVQMSESVLRAEVEKAILDVFQKTTDNQKEIIIAEIKAEDKITRIWRPIVALSMCFILFFYALLLPIAVDWVGTPTVRVGDKLLEWIFNLLTICLGGYVAGRSIEKVAETIMAGWRRK